MTIHRLLTTDDKLPILCRDLYTFELLLVLRFNTKHSLKCLKENGELSDFYIGEGECIDCAPFKPGVYGVECLEVAESI